ncbi:MAG: hypothetical protein VKK99_02325 [Cyanobacteriota bacterium]|nr:hypothetical protein [Cyanobacteriota bacterium]
MRIFWLEHKLRLPTKVVCLAVGNASNAIMVQLLLSYSEEITEFVGHPDASFLLLQRPG